MPPTLGDGKICYVEIPASDIVRSAEFYRTVLGWTIRQRKDGRTAFDDGVGEVSGSWVTGRAPAPDGSLLVAERSAERVGTEVEVLVDQVEDGTPVGRSFRAAPEIDGVVLLDRGEPGDWVRARITGSYGSDTIGEVVG